jgi:RNA recognition motif-containing protein
MANKLFVGSLAWGTTDDSLNEFFAQVGTVVSAKVITDRDSGRSKGFGFVEMSTDEEAAKAVAELNGKDLDGRAINVNEARPQEPRENRGGGGGYGGGNRGGSGGGYSNDRY